MSISINVDKCVRVHLSCVPIEKVVHLHFCMSTAACKSSVFGKQLNKQIQACVHTTTLEVLARI
jgi:hypothetical protein